MIFKTRSNQFGIGIGYRHCKIYDALRHSLWLTYGYATISFDWHRNPSAPRR